MDWELCVICGSGGDLRCPADSHQKNGLEIYSSFLKVVKEYENLQCTPCDMDFKGEGSAETFMLNKAKWHKSCHLKFAPSKLIKVKEQLGKKRQLESTGADEGLRKSRRSTGIPSQENCIFCSEGTGKLHICATMKLDQNLRIMATEMQDTALLAKISGGDLIAIEAKYHYNCLSAFKNRYRTYQREKTNNRSNAEESKIRAQVLVELISYIENHVESGKFIFKLSELHNLYVSRLKDLRIEKEINKTRLKLQLLDYFFGDCQEQFDGRNTLLVFNEGLKKVLKEAADVHDYEADALMMAKMVKLLRREIFSSKTCSFTGHFPSDCQSMSVPTALKLFVLMLIDGPNVKSRSECESQASLTISQLIYFNATAKDHHSKDHEPPFPLYLGLKIHTQTRSKKLVKCLHRAGLSVSYNRVIEMENSLATAICKCFEKENLVCPANLRKGLFTVGAFDNIDHNPSSTTAKGALHGTAMSVFQFPTLSNPGVCREPIVVESSGSHKFSLPDQYTCVPAVSCKTNELRVSEYIYPDSVPSCLDNAKAGEAGWVKHSIELLAKNKLGSNEYISWAAYHASLLPSPVDPPSLIALLPLFYEKAATVSMVKHGMDIQQQITISILARFL